jgi:hypothetical protein
MSHIENDASNNSSILACVFVTDVNVSTEPLPSYDRGIFTEPLPSNNKGIYTEKLPSNDMGDTQQTQTDSNGKKAPAPIGQEVGWTPEPVWTL